MLYTSPAQPDPADAERLAAMRRDYAQSSLDEGSVAKDPMVQFHTWFDAAVAAQVPEPNAMHLATADALGRPSGRVVLLKGIDAGFVFYTNYLSRKGQQISMNPHAALTFFWPELERQIRIEGSISTILAAESDAYFASRPRRSQIGAVASPQSQVITDRAELETRFAQTESLHTAGEIPRPHHWGGYRLTPTLLEFWQGRQSRLHDRIVYERHDNGHWRILRLAP